MSAQSIEMYIQPKNETFFKKINAFFSALGDEDLSLSKTFDSKNLLARQWESLEHLNDFYNCNNSGVLNVRFSTGVLFDLARFIKFLRSLGAEDIEAEVFNDQVGETYYYKNSEYIQEYKESNWNWIVNSDPDFEDELVVVTGRFKGYNRDEIEDLVECFDGTVQKSVNGKTTLIIVGSKPGSSKVLKAEALGVKVMKGDDFITLIDGESEENDEPDFGKDFIVFTGTFQFSREDVECLAEDYDGTVQKNINGKTTLLIVGNEPDEKIVKRAKVENVKTMTGKDFIILVGEE